MNIHLKPELEKLVAQDVERGPYQTADEFVERAVVLLHEQETWLAEHAVEIGAKISEGYAAAKRGELIDAEQGRLSMEQRKRSWLANQRKARRFIGSRRKRSTTSSTSGAISHRIIQKPQTASRKRSTRLANFSRIRLGRHGPQGFNLAACALWLVPTFPNYFIVYDPEAKPLEVIRILHRARSIRTIMR